MKIRIKTRIIRSTILNFTVTTLHILNNGSSIWAYALKKILGSKVKSTLEIFYDQISIVIFLLKKYYLFITKQSRIREFIIKNSLQKQIILAEIVQQSRKESNKLIGPSQSQKYQNKYPIYINLIVSKYNSELMLRFSRLGYFTNFFSSNNKISINNVPSLKDFINKQSKNSSPLSIQQFGRPSFHIQTYGCQMNENDSEIVRSLLKQKYTETQKNDADIVLINTCAIREAAEEKIYHRINQLKKTKVIGILGCMAERLKQKMFAKGVHIVCGPDAYRDLPRLVDLAITSQKSINVQLSVEETYADITPVRKNPDNVTAFLSIMRGCNNMCSFCIVPHVRGRQRSRDLDTIMKQIQGLETQGVKQITFLGQNVNSYHDISKTDIKSEHKNSQGFGETFKLRNIPGYRFQHLLEQAAKSFPNIRFRFTSPHPKDFPEKLLQTIATYNNICNHIHLPIQSGSTQILQKMRRNHSQQSYLNLVKKIRQIIPNVGITTDIICGFCGETQQNFQDTLKLIEEVRYDNAFMFAYSMREKTHAHRNYQDDVPEEIKKQRLKRLIDHFQKDLPKKYAEQIGNTHLILIEKTSKRSKDVWTGRTDNFKKGYIQKNQQLPVIQNGKIIECRQIKAGDLVIAQVKQTKSRVLKCQSYGIASKLSDYYQYSQLVNSLKLRKAQKKNEEQKVQRQKNAI